MTTVNNCPFRTNADCRPLECDTEWFRNNATSNNVPRSVLARHREPDKTSVVC